LQGTYLLASDAESFYLVDQHAAAERINYEKYILELQKNEETTYQLLVPLAVNFSLAEAALVVAMIPDFIRRGLLIEEFGSGSFLVREVPIWIPRGREKEFVEEIITQAINGKKTERYQLLDSLAKSLACKKAIKANDYLNNDEVAALLNDLGKCKNPYTCPHGRPVIVKFSYYEIEKWFKRVV
jgi:DNA mismatch repair protein MutL